MEARPEEPRPEIFGLSATEIDLIEKRKQHLNDRWEIIANVFLVVTLICFLASFANPIMWLATAGLIAARIVAIKIWKLVEKSIPKAKNYSNYRQSYSSYKLEYKAYEKRRKEEIRVEEAIRKKEEIKIKRREYKYWSSLDPYEFEREIARLYKLNGFKAEVTKGSGDGGIDIYLTQTERKGIVQCKRYTKKVGPGPVRDLYGTMVGGGFSFAKIVCPSGFSDKAYLFSKGKNIELVGLKRIMELVEKSETNQSEVASL
jgi:HJR/Mrr/RecB family endonuclease